jgi:hypothetical protein
MLGGVAIPACGDANRAGKRLRRLKKDRRAMAVIVVAIANAVSPI